MRMKIWKHSPTEGTFTTAESNNKMGVLFEVILVRIVSFKLDLTGLHVLY